ncbi:MAG: phosphatidate cytidylyltransferase, partial [Sphaerochaetaceae bacterium]|nr:phosphatidate cytidylyltransferase [Sphaerochaetaceae bacterium]
DLIESVFKRGAKVKDSGKIILGRGGILDSIDSLLASVPFFVLFIILCS